MAISAMNLTNGLPPLQITPTNENVPLLSEYKFSLPIALAIANSRPQATIKGIAQDIPVII
jgi:hypothetical protein